jgi:hypothetical protein
MTPIRPLAAAAIAALAGTLVLASDTKLPALQSGNPATPPVVDGRADEWAALTPFESAHVAVGIANDARALSIAITSSDQAQRRQLVAAGLIVWLDPGGGKKRVVGIRFPGDFRGGGRPEVAGGRGGQAPPPPDSPRAPGQDASAQEPREPRLPPLTWFELRGPRDEDRRRLEKSAVTSIEVARDMREGVLGLELKIPLAKDAATGFGIGVEPGAVVGLGLETPEIERPEGPSPDRAGRGRGGLGGPGGGMGGGMGRGGMGGGGMGGRPEGPAGERPERAKPIKVWTTVKLASGAS